MNNELLKKKEVCNLLQIGMTWFDARIKNLPDFPKPINLFNNKGGIRYRKQDILDYIDKKQVK